jgi:hypothetical protein
MKPINKKATPLRWALWGGIEVAKKPPLKTRPESRDFQSPFPRGVIGAMPAPNPTPAVL